MPWQKTRSRSAAPSDGARPPGLALREAGRRRTRNPRTSNHSAPTRSNLQLFPEKTAVAGFIRRHQLMEFEKSRLRASLRTTAIYADSHWPRRAVFCSAHVGESNDRLLA